MRERVAIALHTPQGQCESTPLDPPFVRWEHQDGAARFLSPLTKGGSKGVLRERAWRACNSTVKRSDGDQATGIKGRGR